MEEKIFRQKSVERMNSPEELNEYIRVSKPGVWLLLAGITVLLVGALIWGCFGSVSSSVDAVVTVGGDGSFDCYTAFDGEIPQNAEIRVNGASLTIDSLLSDAEPALDSGEKYAGSGTSGLSEGRYAAELVVGYIRPISFIIN